MDKTDVKTLWEKIEDLYAKKTGNTKMYVIGQMMYLRYKWGKPMAKHLGNFQALILQLMGV
ncbi:hypothetical protein, partial [Klebsiella variicola]|uniref:hypothetical protein n=1 Tax=Klebsiella variicola TaxID=244366 RepID=UPI00273215FE